MIIVIELWSWVKFELVKNILPISIFFKLSQKCLGIIYGLTYLTRSN